MNDQRQAIDDFTPINPNTGLPKHIYQDKHPHCKGLALRGTFQYKGRKYHTSRVEYDIDGTDTLMSLDEAILVVDAALIALKASTEGYDEYVNTNAYRAKVGRRSKATYDNSIHAKNNRTTSTSMEGVCDKHRPIRHIGSDGRVQ